MYQMLVHSHSGLRWVVLVLLILAIINNGTKWQSGKSFTSGDGKINLFTMISAHIQLVLGISLFFLSPKVKFDMANVVFRFFSVEHTSMMVIAIALITVGHIRSKKLTEDSSKFKTGFIFFLIALLVLLAGIPWPGRGLGGAWF